MEYTEVYSLPHFEMPAGHDRDITLCMVGHATLCVTFIYEPAYEGLACDAGGEPGSDPGAPEFFDFKRIVVVDPMVLKADDPPMRTVVEAGVEISRMLSERTLREIEIDLLQRRHRPRGRRAAARLVGVE